jgi:hypothetical protein
MAVFAPAIKLAKMKATRRQGGFHGLFNSRRQRVHDLLHARNKTFFPINDTLPVNQASGFHGVFFPAGCRLSSAAYDYVGGEITDHKIPRLRVKLVTLRLIKVTPFPGIEENFHALRRSQFLP